MPVQYKIFDKNGFDLTSSEQYSDDGCLDINIQIPPVSVNLFETEHLYIFQRVLLDKFDFFKKTNSQVIGNDLLTNNLLLHDFLDCVNNLTNLRDAETCNDDELNDKMLEMFSESFNEDFLREENIVDYLGYFSSLREGNEKENYFNIETDEFNVRHYSLTLIGEEVLNLTWNKFEKYRFDILNFEELLVTPRFNYTENTQFPFFCDWKDSNTKQDDIKIKLFTIGEEVVNIQNRFEKISNEKNFAPVIKYLNNTEESFNYYANEYQCDSGNEDNFLWDLLHPDRRVISNDNINQKPFEINICVNSNVEGVYKRTLELFFFNTIDNVKIKLANINIECEIIGEDERFSKLLENFGRNIDASDFYVMKDYDLNEDLFDYIFVNEKRKELLLAGDDIFPFLGSDKCFRNGLKWLGYQDLKIREYWYNIKTWDYTNKTIDYRYIEVPERFETNNEDDDFSKQKYSKDLIDSDTWKKTTRLGIVYSYNEFTGEYGDDNLPILKNKNDFDPYELCVKLFGLKKVLYKYFLPHNARIINITLEGIYFTKVKLTNWIDIIPILNLLKSPEYTLNLEEISKPIKIKKLIERYAFYKNESSNYFPELKGKNITPYLNDSLSLYENVNIENFRNGDYDDSDDVYLETIFNQIKDDVDRIFGDEQILIKEISKYSNIENDDFCKIYKLISVPNQITFESFKGVPIGLLSLETNRPENYPNNDNTIDGIFNNYEKNTDDNLTQNAAYIKWTFEDFRMHNERYTEWRISNKDNSIFYFKNGKWSDIGNILFFPTIEGKYDVNCSIHDDLNFPKIVNRKEFVDFYLPIKDVKPFTCGRYIERKIEKFNDSAKFDEIKGDWLFAYVSNISTNFDDCEFLTFNDINFYNYLDCEYYLNYKKESSIDFEDGKITVQNSNIFYDDFVKYSNNWESLYLYRDIPANHLFYEDIPVEGLSSGKIQVSRNLIFDNIKPKDKILCYNILSITNFSIEGNRITIPSSDLQEYDNALTIFQEDSIITLFDYSITDNQFGQKKKDYKVDGLYRDYDNNSIILNIININEDLDFKDNSSKSINLDPEATYNFSNWSRLEMRYNIASFRIKNIEKDDLHNYITLDNNSRNDLKILKKCLNKQYGLFVATGTVPTKIFDIPLTDELKKQIIYSKGSNFSSNGLDFYLDPYMKLTWSSFDLIKGKYQTKFEGLQFEQLGKLKVTFEDLKDYNYNLLNFNSPYDIEFTMSGFENIGVNNVVNPDYFPILKIDDYEYKLEISPEFFYIDDNSDFYISMPNSKSDDESDVIVLNEYKENNLVNYSIIETTEQKELRINNIINQIINYINNCNQGPLKYFYASRKGDSIVCMSYGNIPYQTFKLDSKVIDLDKSNTIPEFTYLMNQIEEFPNIENPKMSDYKQIAYLENEDTDDTIENRMHSVFNIGKTNFDNLLCKKESFILHSPTFLFFKLGNFDKYKNDYDLNWFIYNNDNLLMESNLEYLNLFVKDSGSYSVHVNLKNKESGRITEIKKENWFELLK